MINIVLYEPEIPQNTGNIMRTCAGTGAKLHLIGPLGFSLSDNMIKRSGVNYIEHCDYSVYDDYNDFLSIDLHYNKNELRHRLSASILRAFFFLIFTNRKSRTFLL